MKHTGPAPFGFAWTEGGLRLVEKEAHTRRLAFELYAELQNKAAVAERLNAAGHSTRRGGKWRDVTVSRLLQCPSARGRYATDKTRTDKSGKRTGRPEEECEFVECPSIVSLEVWDRVQTALASKESSSPSPRSGSHPFTGVLFCHCGARMHLTSDASKFACSKCGDRIPIRDLEERFLDEVESYLKRRQSLATEWVLGDPTVAKQRTILHEVEGKLERLETEISKAACLYMENRITLERFEKLHRPLEDERRALKGELGRTKSKSVKLKAREKSDAPQSALDPDVLRERWLLVPPDTRRNLVRTFVSRIIVSDDEIQFYFPFRDPSETGAKSQQDLRPTFSSKSEVPGDEPLYIRLPKPGKRCDRTGMTRAALNELILPSERNGYQPPVESKSLRKREGGKGTRLIIWESLKSYLSTRS